MLWSSQSDQEMFACKRVAEILLTFAYKGLPSIETNHVGEPKQSTRMPIIKSQRPKTRRCNFFFVVLLLLGVVCLGALCDGHDFTFVFGEVNCRQCSRFYRSCSHHSNLSLAQNRKLSNCAAKESAKANAQECVILSQSFRLLLY